MNFTPESQKQGTEPLTWEDHEFSVEQPQTDSTSRSVTPPTRTPLPSSLDPSSPIGEKHSRFTGNEQAIEERISVLLESAGYELVHLEFHLGRHKVIRIFIEKREWDLDGITVEDCAKVTHLLDQPLESLPEVESLFKGAYDLEVSSPGVDRFLNRIADLQRFEGREVRLHIRAALSAEECENPEFAKAHPRQVSFLGILRGWSETAKLKLEVLKDDGSAGAGKKAGKPSPSSKKKKAEPHPLISIPLERILKVQLEPEYDVTD